MAYDSLKTKQVDYGGLFTPPKKISDLYNSLFPGMLPTPGSGGGTVPFSPVTRTLPNSGNTYQSTVVAPPVTPDKWQPTATVPAPTVQTPPPTGAPTPTTPALDYSKYTDPVTGKVMNPQEYAAYLAQRATAGSIPNYAGDSLTQGPQTTPELKSTATDLNNQRNDIAVGATDPYGVASKSGIAYSPSELSAIEKAYAGIYDPALKDVFAKLDTKQKEDAAALVQKNKLAEMAQQHIYDVALKSTPAGGSTTGLTGTYTPGENPTVDAWAERIFNGSSKITDIAASDKAMRNAVTVALQAYGNQPDGKPTTTEIGLQTLDAAKRLKTMFDAGQGTSTVGKSRLFGGGIAVPGSDSANFINLFNNLIANRSLEGVKFLKGQGQVSDAERLLLKNAMSELNLNQSEAAFSKSLQAIIDKLEGNNVSSAGSSVVTAPDGTQVEITD